MKNTCSLDGALFIHETRRQSAALVERIRHCVCQLDDQQLWWRPRESQNSVANLILHLCGNLQQRVMSMIGGEPDTRDRPREFTERGPISREELLRRLDGVASAVDETLSRLDAGRLSEPRPFVGTNVTIDESLLGGLLRTIVHLGGHVQEIIFLTRMQIGGKYEFLGAPPPREMLESSE